MRGIIAVNPSSRHLIHAILTRVFIFLSKFLPLFIFPLGFALLILLVAVVIRRGRRVVILAAMVILWLASSRYVAYALVHELESRHPPLAEGSIADAIVVLGGGTRGDDPPRPMAEVNEAGDRILYGAKLFRDGAAAVVLVTGGSIEWLTPQGVGPEANAMVSLLTFLGVPGDAVWLESESRNTYENALFSKRMLAEAGMDEVLLVTSAMHMPRSMMLFQAQGLRVRAAPTDYLVSDAEWRHLWRGGPTATLVNLMPNVEYLTYTTRALKEYIGIFIYDLRGWL